MAQRKSISKPNERLFTINAVSVAHAVLVAEHLSFRRAAAALGVRASAVSRRVSALEDALGVSLFERHHAGVRITNAGAQFLKQAGDALAQLQEAFAIAGAAGRAAAGHLRIGILSSMGAGFLRELMETYSQQHPDVTIDIVEGSSAKHITLIGRRLLDVAFVADTSGASDCDSAVLWSERLFVVLPRGHALSNRKMVDWSELRGEQLIVPQSNCSPGLCDCVIKNLANQTHAPSIHKLDVGRETLMHLVAMGRGAGITSEAATVAPFPNVVFRPIRGDKETVKFSAVWSPANDNPVLRRFLSLARARAREKRNRPNPPSKNPRRSWTTKEVALALVFLGGLARKLGLLT